MRRICRELQDNYIDCWDGLNKHFDPERKDPWSKVRRLMAERAPDAPRHSLAAWPCAMVMCSSMEGTHWGRRVGEGQLSFDIEAIAAAAFVLSLRERGLRDKAVLGAMERVPRDLFAPRRFADLSRRDVALPLSLGQTMTAPGSVAVMLTALQVA